MYSSISCKSCSNARQVDMLDNKKYLEVFGTFGLKTRTRVQLSKMLRRASNVSEKRNVSEND